MYVRTNLLRMNKTCLRRQHQPNGRSPFRIIRSIEMTSTGSENEGRHLDFLPRSYDHLRHKTRDVTENTNNVFKYVGFVILILTVFVSSNI